MLVTQRFQNNGGFGVLGIEETGSNQILAPEACWREISVMAIASISFTRSCREGGGNLKVA